MKIVQVVGGLGSQMMAYALTLGLKKRGDSVVCDFSWYDRTQAHNGAELQRVFGIHEARTPLLGYLINAKTAPIRAIRKVLSLSGALKLHTAEVARFNFDPSVFSIRGNVVLYQCWTSYKYFDGAEEDVRSAFRFPPIQDEANLTVAEALRGGESVSIHVRLGDYARSKALAGLAPVAYYDRAVAAIRERVNDPEFYVFSDDIAWCRSNFGFEVKQFIDWNVKGDSFRDMQLMSLCRHNIIPHSSFSWWSAWLNENPAKVVVAPERWANLGTGVELKDMNLPDWVILKNYSD